MKLEDAKAQVRQLTASLGVQKARTQVAKILQLTPQEVAELVHQMVDDLIREAPAQLGSLEETTDRKAYVVAFFERGTMWITKGTLKAVVRFGSFK